MSNSKGFREVLNGNANGAGIVLPESQSADYAIDQIGKYGLLQQQNYARQKQYQAQTNKDFADNQLKIAPGLQYQSELNGLAQKWYDKGVQYRRQGFDPFNADYSKPDQAAAAQEYLGEKQHLENLSDLAKGVDADYKAKSAAADEGKLDGFDDYQKALQGHTLQSLYASGGINSLPNLYKPVDLSAVDKSYTIKPQTRQVDTELAPGVTNTETQHYVNMPQAAMTYEQILNNQPGSAKYLAKKGIGNPKGLYTYMGHNMLRDPNNPEDYGHIDEPGIYHQMATDYLTDPNLIKQLPDQVKQRIINGGTDAVPKQPGTPFNTDSAASAAFQQPYNPAQDPDYQKFIGDKFDQQIAQERGYQNEIQSGIMRKLPSVDLGSTSKLDATMANLALRKQNTSMGWQRLADENSNAAITRARWQANVANTGTREKWITDIQNMNTDAVKTLSSALTEVTGSKMIPTKGGFTVQIPETVPNTNAKGNIDPINPKKVIMHNYEVSKYSGKAGRMQIEQILNKLPTIGKEKALKTEPYSPDYNDLGGDNAAPATNDDNADNL